tara:strand:- start:243 stop:668 length:426 start_codon:yes stop_codon:yes gene_type:complete
MINEALNLTGHLVISINDEVVQDIPNLVVTAGKGYVASRMKDATTTAMSHMAIGTGSTAAAAGDTALGSESARVAMAATAVSGAVVTYTATFPAGTGTAAITEAILVNAASSGTILARTVFPVINKSASDSCSISWAVTVS